MFMSVFAPLDLCHVLFGGWMYAFLSPHLFPGSFVVQHDTTTVTCSPQPKTELTGGFVSRCDCPAASPDNQYLRTGVTIHHLVPVKGY